MAQYQSRARIEQLEGLQGKHPLIAYLLNIPLPGLGNCLYGRPIMGVFLMMVVALAILLFFGGGLAGLIGILLIIVSIIGAFFTLGLSLILLPLGLLMLVLGAGPLLSVIMYLFCLVVSELLVATKASQVQALTDLQGHREGKSYDDRAFLVSTVERVQALFEPAGARLPNALLGAAVLGVLLVSGVAYFRGNSEEVAVVKAQVVSLIDGTPPNERASSQTSEPAAQSKASKDINFSDPVFSLNQALETDVFGLRLDMTQEEVLAILVASGFERPLNKYGPSWLSDSGVGINCRDGSWMCRVGGTQPSDSSSQWTRGPLKNGKPQETILPVFYISADKNQRLYGVYYNYFYNPAIFPGDVALQMIERFGAPTSHYASEVRSDLSYHIQMSVPDGYVRTENDDRSAVESIAQRRQQRAIVNSRIDCLENEVAAFPLPRSNACTQTLGQPARQQRIFDALSESKENDYLHVSVKPTQLWIILDGGFLARAAELSVEEAQLLMQLAELKRRREAEPSVPDDL